MTTGLFNWFLLNRRVVVWFPKTTRECFMHGIRWRNKFVGVMIVGDEIDPNQEVYYERVRNLTEVLEKEDTMLVTPPLVAESETRR
jgi:hypothetical protein